ncbi:hypothetical protein ACH4MN_08255 [Streptomyces anulatus]|uniref:hypothetical protein n=1 Tax=Streptomyces TaxID=1883 RepID=UPI00159F0665|nr:MULTISPECIES: hypothetical protein [unclassified Streptomyces]
MPHVSVGPRGATARGPVGRTGDREGNHHEKTRVHDDGGVSAGEAGRFEEAAARLEDALNLRRAANDRTGQARAHAEPAALAHVRGDDVAARRHESAAASLLGRSDGS